MKKANKAVLLFLMILFAVIPFINSGTVSAVFITPPTCNEGDGCMPNCPGAPDPDCTTGCAEVAGSAGLMPCGKSTNDPDTVWNECSPCNLCFMILMGRTIIEFFIKITAIAAILVIIIGGFLYMFAAGNNELLSKAKLAMKYSIFGFITVFISWAIVDSALIVLGYADPMESDGWYNVTCELGTFSPCVPSLECSDYPGQCGSMLSNGCVSILDCSNNCGAQLCCSGTCQDPVCSNDGDCNDGDICTTDTCNNPDTCSAACVNTLIAGCCNTDGSCNGICPPNCTLADDPDCGCQDNNSCCPVGCTMATDNDCCTPSLTCAVDYPGQCGVSLWDGCANALDCSGNCTAPQICCGGTCQDPICGNDGDCSDGDNCTTDTCSNAGTCTASCSNTDIVVCVDGDGCCPAGCNVATDSDCGCTPSLTCAVDYPGQCSVSLWDGCANALDCSGNCTASQICCGGTCQDPICSNDGDCNDNNDCTTGDTCNNAGTCTASCSHAATIVACIDNDSCCPVSCDSTTDNDCAIIPASFDWSHKELPGALPPGTDDWMSPVRMQRCGSCWSYSAIGAVEGKYNIEQNNFALDINLAEGYLVSTCCNAGNCGGGWPDWALGCIENAGVPDDACFPQSGNNDPCNLRCADWSTRLWKIGNYVGENNPTRDEMKSLIVNYGPLSGGVRINEPGCGFVDDIYRCDRSNCNHAIVIVGYDDVGEYWVVRNSWGSRYNGNGYYKVGYGECGIETWGVYYPVGVTSP